MSDQSENNAGFAIKDGQTRLAYTLNNEQPVRCTLISEDPLFYLDTPIVDEDEGTTFGLPGDILLDLPEETRAPLPTPDTYDPVEIFHEQFGQTGSSKISERTQDLNETLTTLRSSRLAASLLDFINEQGIVIRIQDQITPILYDRMAGLITIRPQLSMINQTLLLVRELRRVWQHRQGALLHPLLFHPDHAIVINRVQAADLMTTMIRIAWELRLAGQHEIWNNLDQNGHHDLTRSFAREALMDFRSLNNGRAAAAAFESWFLSERCRSYDRVLIQQMLADYQSYVFRAGHEETSRVLTQQVIAALGAMPYGKNYLAAYAATILADPIFTDIRDRSNANFLWFIKFEQSFRATERDLQIETQMEGTVVPAPSSTHKEPVRHASETTATIIKLPARTVSPETRATGTGKAIIVDLDGWRTRSRGD